MADDLPPQGEVMAISFGPLSLFRRTVRYVDSKVASRFAKMDSILPLGAYSSGAYMGNPG